MGTNDFWTNAYLQVHNLWSTIGIALAIALAQFILDNETFTLRMVVVTLLGAGLKYYATRDDHKKTDEAVKNVAVTGEVPTITKGELK
jgi:hypothetical protein